MASHKLSDFPPFVGRDLLMAAQKRGREIVPPTTLNATDIILIGLASLLAEHNVIPLKDS